MTVFFFILKDKSTAIAYGILSFETERKKEHAITVNSIGKR